MGKYDREAFDKRISAPCACCGHKIGFHGSHGCRYVEDKSFKSCGCQVQTKSLSFTANGGEEE